MRHTSIGPKCIVTSVAIPKGEISNLEVNNMQLARGYIASLLLTAALAAPVSILAASMPQTVGVQVRVYDKNHKDYHNWDDRENHAWGRLPYGKS